MQGPLKGFRVSTARRSRAGIAGRLVLVLLGTLVVVTVLVVRRDGEVPPPPPPTAAPEPAPLATPRRAPTRPLLEPRSSDWVVAVAPSATPTWWPTTPPRPRRAASPTPSLARCVSFRWGAGQSAAAWGNVLVEIEATNRCGRPIQPTELWFQVTGYRDGDLVQTVRGHPFNTIFPGRSETFAVGLPGSIDWYDEITVQITD